MLLQCHFQTIQSCVERSAGGPWSERTITSVAYMATRCAVDGFTFLELTRKHIATLVSTRANSICSCNSYQGKFCLVNTLAIRVAFEPAWMRVQSRKAKTEPNKYSTKGTTLMKLITSAIV